MRSAVLALVVAPALASPSAYAFDTTKLGQWGSLTLDEITPLIAKTPKLKGEIDAALAKAKKKDSDIHCNGQRFPGSWKNLGGERVAPYVCQIGARWITIRADVQIVGKNARVYAAVSPDAMKNAREARQSNLTWTWSDKEPDGQ